ncbi:MAG: DNA double-strand break repair nuclease NurA [Anaerolineae bacterium]|nr:DNA double-strand break repair nuclease NurA [Anaerolineae bacterium]
MVLEFQKLTQQVDKMGAYLAAQEVDIESKLEIALRIMEAYADPALLALVHERVQDAVEKDAGYRGARPLDEPIMHRYLPAAPPASATIVATDGSQIAPDRHSSSNYYLLNTGTIIIHTGSGMPPTIISEPYLFYETGYLQTTDRAPITAAIVSARRTVAEMAALAENAWHQRGEARPLLALLDGPLLFVMGKDVPDRSQLLSIYFGAMTRLREVNAGLVGYTDRPRSRFAINMLHLLDLAPETVSRSSLANDGRLEGIRDIALFATFLDPGERSALFVQMSPQNKEFRRAGGDSHEIAFFYLNVAGQGEPPKIARVDIPMWVAENRELVGELQVLIYLQCQELMSRYPYALTRADELALVKFDEARQLDLMIQVALNRQGVFNSRSDKQKGKDAARSPRTRFEMR